MDRLDAMFVFLAVVDAGSLSAAARRLGAPLPTVSRKVADLERHLGTQLLIRTSRRVELTEAGRDYAIAVRQIVEQLQEAELTAAGEYQEPRGELTVTAPTMFGESHVLPIASEFLAAHPKIDLRLLLTDVMVNLVEAHVHVAVRIGELEDSGLIARRVGVTRSMTCASPSYLRTFGTPEAPEDLTERDGVTYRGFIAVPWRYVRHGVHLSAEPRARVAVNSPAAAVVAAKAGLGITRVLDYQIAPDLRSGALTPLLERFELPPLPINLVFSGQGRLPLKLRAFLDWMAPRLQARLAAEGVGAPPEKNGNRGAGPR
ncbi:transcriptional regulator, LysR family [Nannocystis exedens]|uniref:Transcriptional regulator, LysR family n=1 Tax=Nannocystis exedens TaxID=54 RepID=A0A1I1XG02_9BACT|nr:LysR family transcriptional regulator [Nannocystis exedens]PCC73432.1 LysR family transcriptional regulator [Nannocystis exedens]SFE06339.1 transcriptional regulator, LysR family [Nannocystis exedens]